MAPEHITVNAISPGVFPSKMTAPFLEDDEGTGHWAIPLGRIGGPGDIVGAVLFLSSAAGAYLTGVVLPVAGGMTTPDY